MSIVKIIKNGKILAKKATWVRCEEIYLISFNYSLMYWITNLEDSETTPIDCSHQNHILLYHINLSHFRELIIQKYLYRYIKCFKLNGSFFELVLLGQKQSNF